MKLDRPGRPWQAVGNGIQYQVGRGFLTIRTLQSLRLETFSDSAIEEAEMIEIGDALERYDGAVVKDLLEKRAKGTETRDYELMLEHQDGSQQPVQISGDRVIERSSRHVTESPLLEDDLEDCPNYDPDATGDEQ